MSEVLVTSAHAGVVAFAGLCCSTTSHRKTRGPGCQPRAARARIKSVPQRLNSGSTPRNARACRLRDGKRLLGSCFSLRFTKHSLAHTARQCSNAVTDKFSRLRPARICMRMPLHTLHVARSEVLLPRSEDRRARSIVSSIAEQGSRQAANSLGLPM
jgi:hypothetical protein